MPPGYAAPARERFRERRACGPNARKASATSGRAGLLSQAPHLRPTQPLAVWKVKTWQTASGTGHTAKSVPEGRDAELGGPTGKSVANCGRAVRYIPFLALWTGESVETGQTRPPEAHLHELLDGLRQWTHSEPNRERPAHAQALARGYPTRSGSIEAACDTITGLRDKPPGIRWRKRVAETIAHLRGTDLTGRRPRFRSPAIRGRPVRPETPPAIPARTPGALERDHARQRHLPRHAGPCRPKRQGSAQEQPQCSARVRTGTGASVRSGGLPPCVPVWALERETSRLGAEPQRPPATGTAAHGGPAPTSPADPCPGPRGESRDMRVIVRRLTPKAIRPCWPGCGTSRQPGAGGWRAPGRLPSPRWPSPRCPEPGCTISRSGRSAWRCARPVP